MFYSYLCRERAKKEWLSNDNADSSDGADRFALQLQRVASQRSSFCITNGFFGLGPSLLHGKNEIWFPMGAKMLFVFRPVEAGLFKVRGQTYLHGIMRGEAVIGLAEEGFQSVMLC
jgi:hypothetical protein